jgi:hypothetical protein
MLSLSVDKGEKVGECSVDFVVAPVGFSCRQQLGHGHTVREIGIYSQVHLSRVGLHVTAK